VRLAAAILMFGAVASAQTLPPNPTFTSVTAGSITLTGGQSVAPGVLWAFETPIGGTIAQPTPIPASGCVALNPVVLPKSTKAVPTGQGSPQVTIPASVTATSRVFVTATFAGGVQFPVNFEPFARIPYAGSINIYARFMPYGSGQKFAGGTVTVEVCP
jgi:hypothetical protein